MKMISDHKETETVYRRDLCIVQQRHLPLQMLILRLSDQTLPYRSADPLTHLCRRRIRKRHDQKSVNIYGMSGITYHFHDTFYQHRRLARSGRRRHQQITAVRIDHHLLLFRI